MGVIAASGARREQLVALAGTIVLAALAWRHLIGVAAAMGDMAAPAGAAGDMPDLSGMAGMVMPGMGEARPAPAGWGLAGSLFVMWAIMMVAMMLPSALPTILLFARLQEERAKRPGARVPGVPTSLFVLGYLIVWTAYSALAAAAQWGLQRALLVSPAMTSASVGLSGGLLLVAGAYQLTPLKERCVRHCRSPLSFLTLHWREGAPGAVRMGLHHGAYCVGCCWALMTLLFVLGVMNLFWVLALAAIVLAEKVLPRRIRATPAVGLVLMGAGIWMIARW